MKQHIKLYEAFILPSQFLQTTIEIEDWLDRMGIRNYEISSELFVNVSSKGYDGNEDDDINNPDYDYTDVKIEHMKESHLPVRFGEVYGGNFDIVFCENLVSLVGCPTEIMEGGNFYCCYNPKLKTLKGMPNYISDELYLQNNGLRTLIYIDKKIPMDYSGNPCSKIYDEFGFTIKGHIESLVDWGHDEPEEMKEFLKDLEIDREEIYQMAISDKRIRIILGMEGEELTKTYQKVNDIEKGYF